MNLSLKKTLKTLLLTLIIIPLGISGSLAVNSINTEIFISDLKTRITENYQVNPDDIIIEWKEKDQLQDKIAEIKKMYPDKNIEIKVKDVIIKDIAGRSGIPVDVFIDDKPNRILFLKCNVNILKEALVARTIIKRGDTITEDNVKYSKVPFNKVPRNVPQMQIASVVGKVATLDINENSVITSNLLKEKTVIFRGNQVTIRLRNGDLILSNTGLALQDGYIGQNIQVKVLGFSQNKNVTGRVIGTDLVEIDLGEKN